MKKFMLLSLTLFIMLAAGVAAQVDITDTTATGDVTIPLTYENLEDDDDSLAVSQLFTVENKCTASQTVTLALADITDTNINLTLSTTSFTLAAGATQSVTLTGTMPVTFDSGVTEFGKLRVTFGANTVDIGMDVSVASMIEITDLDVDVGEERSTNIDDGDKIDDEASPGDEIIMTFKVNNLFDQDFDDGDLEDVEITVQIDDNDFGDDIDEDSREFDVDADEDERGIEVRFDIPDDAEDGNYDVNIEVKGDDENGNTHTFTMTVELEVEILRDDVRIDTIDLGVETLQCVRTTSMSIRVKNYGSDDQDDVLLQIDSPELGIDEDFSFELDQVSDRDDDERKSFTLSVGDDVAAGTYRIDVRVFIERDELQEDEIVYIKVEDCPLTADEEDEEVEVIVQQSGSNQVTGSAVTSGTSDIDGTVVESVETPFTQSSLFIALLVGLNIIGLAIVVILAIKMLK